MKRLAATTAILAAQCLFGTTRYMVPAGTAGNTPAGEYDTWDTAANDLPTLIAKCATGDTILVGTGVYHVVSQAKSDSKVLYVRSCNRDTGLPDAANTIFDGSECVETAQWLYLRANAKGSKVEDVTFRNFPCTAMFFDGAGPWTVAGCFFRNNTGTNDNHGAGIKMYKAADMVVSNCVFTGNLVQGTSYNNGGACYAYGNDDSGEPPLIVSCEFDGENAVAANRGGAIGATGRINVRNCSFKNFEVSSTAGAINIFSAAQSSVISGCIFTGNMRATYAPAVNLDVYAIVSNCIFTGISASGSSYGLVRVTDGIVHGCSFTNNSAVGPAHVSVMTAGAGSARRISNCLMESAASGFTSAIQFYNAGTANPLKVENCTIYVPSKKIVSTPSSDATAAFGVDYVNSILVGDRTVNDRATATFDHCAYSADDDFVNSAGHDYKLRSTSPCIDAGTEREWHSYSTDIGGRARVVGSAVDIGCWERQADDTDYVSIVRAVANAADRTGDWAGAYVGIQAAIDAAEDRSLVLVRSGEYAISDTIVISNRILDVKSANPSSGETDRDGTVLDGQGARRVMIVHHGPQSDSCIPTNERNVRLEGFTFRDGWTRVGDGQDFSGDGGGLLLFGRAPSAGKSPSRIVDCCFTNCSAFNGGGAAIIGGVFEDCLFAGNSATETDGHGGAVAAIARVYKECGRLSYVCGMEDLWLCPGFIGCTFTNNVAARYGGALAGDVKNGYYCSVYVSGCRFVGNHTENGGSSRGSAIADIYGSLVSNCVFTCNTDASYGVVCNLGIMLMVGCDFIDNTAANGAVYGDSVADDDGHGTSIIDRCRFLGHSGYSFFARSAVRNTLFAPSPKGESSVEYISLYNGAMSKYQPLFQNCTFVRGDGRAIVRATAEIFSPVFENCILWRTDGGGEIFKNVGENTFIALTNCCLSAEIPAAVSSRFAIANTIVANPYFSNAATGDYSLKYSSPCRAAGTVLGWMDAASVDIVGAPRLRDGEVDMGCYQCWVKPLGFLLMVR